MNFLSQTKIFNHLDRLQEWLQKDLCFPMTIEIDPTNNCTRSCLDCAGNRYAKGSSLSLGFMKSVITQIKPFCRGLIFTGGGEPLQNKDTLKAIEFAKKNKIDVAIVTNGDLLDENISNKLVKYCTYIRISIYDDKNWDKVKSLTTIRNKKKSDCLIGTGFLTNKSRINLMSDFLVNSKETGVDYAQFRPFHLDNTDLREEIRKLRQKFDSNNFKVTMTEYKYEDMDKRNKKEREYPVPFVDNFRTSIAADGKVYSDCWTRGIKEFCLGDLNKKSFDKIWKSKKRKQILNSRLDYENCPPMSYHEPLSKLLWQIREQYTKGKHINFV